MHQSQTNSVFFPPNNEKRAIQAKQDQLKREQSKPEHKAPKHHVEVATSDLHRTPESNIGISPRQPNQPAAAIPQGWKGGSPEGGEGGIRKSRRPRSLVPPQGAIKSTRAMRYSSWRKTKKAIQAKRKFRIKKTSDQSQTKNPRTVVRYISPRLGLRPKNLPGQASEKGSDCVRKRPGQASEKGSDMRPENPRTRRPEYRLGRASEKIGTDSVR